MVGANSQFATVWGCLISFFGFFAKATGRTVRQIWTTEGSKRVVPRKEVPFLCLKDVLLIFFLGGEPKKLKFLGRDPRE